MDQQDHCRVRARGNNDCTARSEDWRLALAEKSARCRIEV